MRLIASQPKLLSCQARTDASCSFFDAPAALRFQLHSAAMLLQPRLAGTPNYFAILWHFKHDTAIVLTEKRENMKKYLFIDNNNLELGTGWRFEKEAELKRSPQVDSEGMVYGEDLYSTALRASSGSCTSRNATKNFR